MLHAGAGACAAAALALLLGGCAVPPPPAEPIAWSPEWFACEGRFQCIVVYDAFCDFTPVNASHARSYELWANQEVRRLDEKVPCPPAAGQPVPVPVCRKGQCELF
ncbi:MAG TPA: hypothetical protein VFE85_03100 [Woeseiaceae bacterium]|nr:hypothetical protein [Woeseiaceae bacterium]